MGRIQIDFTKLRCIYKGILLRFYYIKKILSEGGAEFGEFIYLAGGCG